MSINLIEKIVTNLIAFKPKQIYLFGSQATGQSREGSDYDICVIISRTQDKNQFLDDAYLKMYDLGIPVDIVVFYEDQFQQAKNLVNSIPNEVLISGKEIYAA
jgi:predicted nucleotidyltransferase